MGIDFRNSTSSWFRIASGASNVDESWNTGLYSSGFNTNPLTIGIVFEPDATTADDTLFGHGRDTNDNWVLRVASTGNIEIWNDLDNGAGTLTGTTSLSAGTVYKCIVTIDASAGTKIYLDSNSVEASATGSPWTKSMSSAHDWGRYTMLGLSTGLTIGSKTEPLNGKIYDFFLSSSIWSSDQIAQYMNGLKYYPLHDSNLILYYPLDDYEHNSALSDNTQFRDMSGNGYHGKMQQGSTYYAWESRGLVYPSPVIPVIATAGGTSATATPSSQSVSLTLNAPTVDIQQDVTPTPSSQSLSLTQNAPTISATANPTVTPSSQSMSLTLNAPVVVIGNTVSVSSQSLTLTQNAPTISATANPTVTPASQSLSLTQNAPTIDITGDISITPSTQSVTLTLNAPSIVIVQDATVTPSNFTVSLTQNAPVVNTDSNVTVTPSSQTMTLTLNAPTVAMVQSVTPTPSSQSMALTLNAPVVVAIQNPTVTPTTQTLTLALQTATGITFVGVSVLQELNTVDRLGQNILTKDRVGQTLESM